MKIIDGQKFRDQTVHLDGTTYRNCDIERCRIVYSGGEPFGLEGCRIVHNTWFLEGAALRTMRTLGDMAAIPDLRSIVDGWIKDIQGVAHRPPQTPPVKH